MAHGFWILLAILFMTWKSFPFVHGEASYNYSTNPADYDFGWFAIGTHPNGSVPSCSWCANGLTYDLDHLNRTADLLIGPYWNLSVGTFRCDGVEPNEMWTFHEPTQTIVFGNLTQILCIDAIDWISDNYLKLRYCNSSLISQQWRRQGSQVFSMLKGTSGEELFMVGEYPNPSTNPTNQQYAYRVTLNSAIPTVSSPGYISGYSYSSAFTFLSSKNFVDRATDLFTTEGVLAITNSTKDKVVNGDFEMSTIQVGVDIIRSDWTQASPSYFALCGWVIDFGPIEYVKDGFLPAEHGYFSVHLNAFTDTSHRGQISQTFVTEVGSNYQLSFYFNAFPIGVILSTGLRNCSATYVAAQMQVRITNSTSTGKLSSPQSSDGSTLLQNFSHPVSSENATSFVELWQAYLISFTALTNVTTLSFESLNFNNSCGPVIDNVAVLRIKPKPFSETTAFGIIIGVVAGLAGLVVILLGVYYGRRRYCIPEEDYSGVYKSENARIFSLKELSVSTKNFSAVLGEGAFGTVYKAEFSDGTAAAVKVEKPKQRVHIGFHSTRALASEEIVVLLRIHHRNLVNLTGICIHKGQQMLVFEYLPNGSLYDRLHQSVIPNSSGRDIMDSVELRQLYSEVFPWDKRVKIACDVAYGLEYLHHDADPPIVHRDVKSRNILLTATDSAKLADFGLSKAAPAEATTFHSIETMVRGSIGYLDPQYYLTGVFSTKSDVYSYGVVLLELISGHQAIHNAASLASWAAPYLTSESLYADLVDKKLEGKFKREELESLVDLVKMCMDDDSKLRPTMRQVVTFLHARNISDSYGESSEQVTQDTISRAAYHKMHPLFIDFERVAAKESDSGDSTANVFASPSPRE